jgi:hypothetical protein
MDVKELAEELSNFVNSGDSRKLEKLAELMIQDHRTLQQLKMKLACLFIEKMAAQEFHDARNEASVKTARAMIAGYKSHAKEEIIQQDGCISESNSKFIDEKRLPSMGLPTI